MRPSGPGAEVRSLVSEGRFDDAWRLLVDDLLGGDAGGAWSIARNVLRAGAPAGWSPPSTRELRLAVLCTYESAELREHLRIACLALRIRAEVWAAPYGQVEQELLGGDGALAAFAPTHVLIAPTSADLGFPELGENADELVEGAESRWRTLWELIRRDLGARVIQHTFVVPDESALGHLSMRLAASRVSLVRELNRRLAVAAGADVLLLDTDRIAARLGKQRWFDPRLWYAARQPFSQEALPLLARETAAVLAGDLGLAARCLVVDLDNTLWGGIVGEDGADGVVIGEGPDGEAYAAFQEYLRALLQRGVILAVASKNDLEAARAPFVANPAMRLGLDDFSMFVADWRPKSEQVSEIAETLGLGLDSIVFVDDNPAECAEVGAALPEITTVCLDLPPSERVRRLASSVRFEASWLSHDDLGRQRSYAARGQASQLQSSAGSIEEFWRSLQMRARVRRVDSSSMDRAAALIQKTNQFNLTLRRHPREEVERLARDDAAICMTLELEDRFARHGLIGLGIVVASADEPGTAVIDTLLLSCRVIGRTAETHLLSHLAREAASQGHSRLRGLYAPGPRNGLVADLYSKLGFAPQGDGWEYDLERGAPIESLYISDQE
ncbi:MAG: HAD-IIIC family phosphatase [Actinomycetota bacterium]|nr:HAD-IIIC family phosphatase [Actinomycetota bacterium]